MGCGGGVMGDPHPVAVSFPGWGRGLCVSQGTADERPQLQCPVFIKQKSVL